MERGATCMSCAWNINMKPITHQCAGCGRELQEESFTRIQWRDRHERGATCMDCHNKANVGECFE
eukprot:3262327-Karenia_brevis.AAC.1